MKNESPEERRGSDRAGWLKLAGLAVVLAAGTWLLLKSLLPTTVPDDFPRLPDLAAANPGLRNLLVSADKEARRRPGSAEAVGRLGMAYQANQYPDEAAEAYRIAARLEPGDYQWAYCQASLQEESGNEKEQFNLLQRTIRLKPGYVPALLKLADAYFKQENLEQAAHHYELAAKASDQGAGLQAAFGLARVAASKEDWNKVIEYAGPLVQSYPHVRPPFQLLQKAYESTGQADKAAELREAILAGKFTDVPPPKDALHDQLVELSYSSTRLLKEAGLLSRFGYPDLGLQVARRALDANASDADIHNFIAHTLLTYHGDNPEAIDEALRRLSECLRLKPDDPTPLWGFTQDFFDKPKTPAAVERLRALLRPYAGRADARYYLGLVADSQGDAASAISYYLAALKNDPNNYGIYNKLGALSDKIGRFDAAISYFQKAVQMNPMDTNSRSNLGAALMQQGNYDQGFKELNEVIRLKPHDAPARFCMGFAFLFSKKYDEAVTKFREGLRYDPGDPEAHYGLGSALAMQQKREDAVRELREALRLRPNYPEAQELLQRLGG
ncbi:MAG TPA: tetratricopeptide repeat protein [Candidatus Acidoferrales bacterium]|nr:tetratricopeptide repeat protein [Candidatus Acidoferrales bacterium]